MAIINKERRCTLCIHSVKCDNLIMIHPFSSEINGKPQKKHIQRQGKKKKVTADAFKG